MYYTWPRWVVFHLPYQRNHSKSDDIPNNYVGHDYYYGSGDVNILSSQLERSWFVSGGFWVSLTKWGSEKAWLVFWKVWKGQKGLFCLYDRRGCGCGNDVKVKNIKPSQKKSVFLLKDAAASAVYSLMYDRNRLSNPGNVRPMGGQSALWGSVWKGSTGDWCRRDCRQTFQPWPGLCFFSK